MSNSSDSEPIGLADFFIGDSRDPLTPPDGFTEWRKGATRAIDLFEPVLLGAAEPRCRIVVGKRERSVINLASYNYLGLARHPEVIAAAQDALAKYGTGACGSPLLSGMTDLHRRLESRISAFLGREAALLFSSGFSGAMGCMAGLLRRGDAGVVDGKTHISLTDGLQLSRAKIETVAHNDPAAFDAALARHTGERCFVVVEGIYSMDGDAADLPALCSVAERHGASVFVDEAHSLLTRGPRGRGECEEQGVEERVGLFFGTFSKAFAGVGGFVSGRAETIDYLRGFAHSYGYSCALPPATVAGLLAALEVVERDPAPRLQLAENAAYFRDRLAQHGLDTGASRSHVVPIFVGSRSARLHEMGHALLHRGLFMAPIDYPAVPQDQLRFRASITAAHSRADLNEALAIIEDVFVRGNLDS